MKQVILFIILLFPQIVFGQSGTGASGLPTLNNPVARINTPNDLIDLVILIVQYIGTPIIVLMLIYTGYKFVTAAGDEKGISEAKQMLLWTLVGAAIVLGATPIRDIVVATMNAL